MMNPRLKMSHDGVWEIGGKMEVERWGDGRRIAADRLRQLVDIRCGCRTLAAETSTYASILTITAFTVERYVAICHPVKSRLHAFSAAGLLHRAVRLVLVIWVVAGVCSLPIVVQYGVVYVQV